MHGVYTAVPCAVFVLHFNIQERGDNLEFGGSKFINEYPCRSDGVFPV